MAAVSKSRNFLLFVKMQMSFIQTKSNCAIVTVNKVNVLQEFSQIGEESYTGTRLLREAAGGWQEPVCTFIYNIHTIYQFRVFHM